MTPLKEKILRLIRDDGPIGVGHYMHLALMDPEHGYYVTRDPLGLDFITAPEVSQLFGEMIGLFLVQTWEDRGRPAKFHLAEMGPGRGTLMADILRAAKIRPAFIEAAHVVLLEASPVLRAVQRETLKGARVTWAEGLDTLTGAPVFLAANEFLDALPAHQFVKSKQGWHGRVVTAKDDDLVFATTNAWEPSDFAPAQLGEAPEGAVLEIGTEAMAAVRTISDCIVSTGGCALIVDYGHAQTAFGDTFQAMKAHGYADPLAEPGEADLTFHVDFAAIAAAARKSGAHVCGPAPQGAFLDALGIRIRAERLKQASPENAADIEASLDRLTNPKQMGTLFKVLGICDGRAPGLPGFPDRC